MNTNIILEDYQWFVDYKADILSALNAAQLYSHLKGLKLSEQKYNRLWRQMYEIVYNEENETK